MQIQCPDYVLTAIKLLESSGYEAYAVGGCVRDSVMGKSPNDWDMTTSALPEQCFEVFKNYKIIPTGIKHGTVTVMIDTHSIEITTMRIDGNYKDNRRPESVEFTDRIAEDLSRRDFTVNAMAYNPERGITDEFGGKNDIKDKIIRCVGNPDNRFKEDALRILRALRFASVLGFDIEKNTSESIIKNKHLLHNIASERIRTELIKLLTGQNAEKILTDYCDVIFEIIPELKPLYGFNQRTEYHIYDIWSHTVKAVAAIENEPELKVVALLHDIGKPEKFTVDENGTGHFKGHPAISAEKSRVILKRLRFPNKSVDKICKIISLHDLRPDGSEKQLKRWCGRYSAEIMLDTFKMMKAHSAAQNPVFYNDRMKLYNKCEKITEKIISEKACISIADLKVNGRDISSLGAKGKEIGNALSFLLDCVIDGKICNEREELLNKAKEFISDKNF